MDQRAERRFGHSPSIEEVFGLSIENFIPFSGGVKLADRWPVLLVLLAFLITFALTRAYTRVARLRGQTHGDMRHSTMRRYRRLLSRLPR